MDDVQENRKKQWRNRVFCHQNDARVTNFNHQFLNGFDHLIDHVWWNLLIILKKMHTDN